MKQKDKEMQCNRGWKVLRLAELQRNLVEKTDEIWILQVKFCEIILYLALFLVGTAETLLEVRIPNIVNLLLKGSKNKIMCVCV